MEGEKLTKNKVCSQAVDLVVKVKLDINGGQHASVYRRGYRFVYREGKYIYLLVFNRVHGNNITQVGLRPGEIQLVQPVPTTVNVH